MERKIIKKISDLKCRNTCLHMDPNKNHLCGVCFGHNEHEAMMATYMIKRSIVSRLNAKGLLRSTAEADSYYERIEFRFGINSSLCDHLSPVMIIDGQIVKATGHYGKKL